MSIQDNLARAAATQCANQINARLRSCGDDFARLAKNYGGDDVLLECAGANADLVRALISKATPPPAARSVSVK